MTITRQILVKHLENQFGLNTVEIGDKTLLFSDGFLDSLAVADLLMFIEEQSGFIVEPSEVTLDNLDSIERILTFVRRKTDLA